MCLTEDTLLLTVRCQDVDSQSPRCRLGDVLLPAQSHMVPDSIPVCTNEDSLSKFRELEEHFNSDNVAGGDPWTHVDVFGKVNFYKCRHTTYKSKTREPKTASCSRSASSPSSSTTSRRHKGSHGKRKKKVAFGLTVSAKDDKAPNDSEQTTTKS